LRGEEGDLRGGDEDMEIRIAFLQAMREGIIDQNAGPLRKDDLCIFRALRERVARWKLGPEIGLGSLFKGC